MKNPTVALRSIVAGFFLLVATMAQAEVVFNNSSNIITSFNPGTIEVGDEVTLGGTDRVISLFVFEYWGLSFSGDETARIRFYANDGPQVPDVDPASFEPGTLLFDSGTFDIGETVKGTLIFDQTALNYGVLVPDSFTWTVQFGGIDGGESAGVFLYDPPTVGSSFFDYWDNDSGWTLREVMMDSTNVPMNFGAYIEAVPVPEPSALTIAVLGGLALLGSTRRFRRK